MNFAEIVIKEEWGTIETNISFKNLTTIGCGGSIDWVFSPSSVESLAKAYQWIMEHNIRYFVIGNGSNVLASDDDFHGVVICLNKMPYQYKVKDNILDCSAFYPTTKLAYDLAKDGYGDLSFYGGIPGLLGGAIYNNSGAFNSQTKDRLIDVTYINTAGKKITLTNEECAFQYRKSIFHSIKGIIISARFKVDHIQTLELLNKRNALRKLTQPLECKSMGSIFKNNKLIQAWKVVDALGMRGFRIADAAVSAKHANFIINLGNAKTKDIESLIELIKRRAFLEFGITLQCEITEI